MQPRAHEEIQALAVALADGNREAMAPLYRALWPVVVRFAARALQGAGDPEDVAQETMLKVFSNIGRFDPERRALPWVLGTAAYECRTARQKVKRRKEGSARELERVATQEDPEAALLARDLESAALEVLGTLGPSDVETLRAVMDAQPPQLPAATFRKRVERAARRLRSAWRLRHDAE